MCYKESNQEQLQAFTEELEQEGKLTEETKTLFKQLEETKPVEEDHETGTIPSYMVNIQYIIDYIHIYGLECKHLHFLVDM